MRTLTEDLRYAARALRRVPGFALVAILTLGLGIGAATSLFSVVHGVLLRSLPFAEPERLVRVYTVSESERRRDLNLSPANFASLREESRAFSDVVVYGTSEMTLAGAGATGGTGPGEPRRVAGGRVSAGFFELLMVRPLLGRTFRPEENTPGNDRVVVLAHALWQRTFAGDAAILDQTVVLDGVARTVVGVMPPGFAFPAGTELWLPREYTVSFAASSASGRGGGWLETLARLRPGVRLEDAAADLRTVGRRLETAFPRTNAGVSFTLVPLREQIVAGARTPLLVLLGAVGLVLLLVCVNVAGLLLARGAGRQGEIALRAALGASRTRLVRQLMTESVLLAALGGALGVLVAVLGTRALVAMRPEGLPRLEDVRVDGAVLAFAAGLTLLAGILVGTLPALRGTRSAMAGRLREAGRGGVAARGTTRLRDGLVMAQMGLAVVLLAGAGLLLRSFLNLTAVDPGFRTDRTLEFAVDLPSASYATDASIPAFHDALAERLRALPGVRAAGAVSRLPLSGRLNTRVQVAGRPPSSTGQEEYVETRSATPGYFASMGIALRRGRAIEAGDRAGSAPVVVISESAARRWFAREDPVGRQVRLASLDEPRTIVGVVGDVRHLGLDQAAAPHAYLPLAQVPRRAMHVVVHAAGDPAALAGVVRREVRALDPRLPPPELRALEQVVSDAVARPRFIASLLGVFALLALALASLGLFGLLSYTVAQRTREIGIRVALGARAGEVLGMVLRRALRLAALGTGAGIVGAFVLTRFASGLLHGVSPTDPATLALVVLLLVATALLASLAPARRAAAVQPTVALQHE